MAASEGAKSSYYRLGPNPISNDCRYAAGFRQNHAWNELEAQKKLVHVIEKGYSFRMAHVDMLRFLYQKLAHLELFL